MVLPGRDWGPNSELWGHHGDGLQAGGGTELLILLLSFVFLDRFGWFKQADDVFGVSGDSFTHSQTEFGRFSEWKDG